MRSIRAAWNCRPDLFQVALAFVCSTIFLLAGMREFWYTVLLLTSLAWLTNSILDSPQS